MRKNKNMLPLFYPKEGEPVRVVLQIKYPSYEFIFGVPDKSSHRHEKEAGFFLFKDHRTDKSYGHYWDVQELLDVQKGIGRILSSTDHETPRQEQDKLVEAQQKQFLTILKNLKENVKDERGEIDQVISAYEK